MRVYCRVVHTVIVTLPVSGPGSLGEYDEMVRIEGIISDVAEAAGGYVDGHDFGAGDANIFVFCPDADGLLDAMQPRLAEARLPSGSSALKRYGDDPDDPDVREVRVVLA